ncbi:BlaI/MecI/CopY family transcriptional regulator [Oculatella sp. FACHB-28]|uniref:BlaI/MecI/CopY family transcriptional regulator n=1 Tax=Cyanophyceae TaxID=3028117 RepID=UPI001688D4F7|nr:MULTISPECIES: BlaI/MecI/CopY family transcriptional regulator [Cyanophyceae]MBD1867445.1 BlaI/MecI/CopY family transcriptional regulator [Cyanobacteria bacterium FACHB-471]MBD2001132.1 BlaI/MecI/CopY family transcriptional regulator [Leptolyngbya sp. FACHB-541]MBD2059083.1 BlaI/MecI/CopY family transcriptional regulator [Oculatella sp. FACHB-28]
MSPLPDHRPKQLTLGSLESEILSILWELESATVKEIHDRILSDPDRELAQASVTTVLNRLAQKGWVVCHKQERAFQWQPRISQEEARVLQAHAQLNRFLAVSDPDTVAAFADSLDVASLDQIEAIAERIRAARQAKKEQ